MIVGKLAFFETDHPTFPKVLLGWLFIILLALIHTPPQNPKLERLNTHKDVWILSHQLTQALD